MNPSHRYLRIGLAALGGLAMVPSAAWAGMGAVTIEEVATYLSLSQMTRERLQAISFFAVGVLISALILRALWNSLAKDFKRLPRLTYGKALGLVLLWGLLFLLVLTMISGARELMTPGAWEKKGLLYELKAEPGLEPPVTPGGHDAPPGD